jgi:glutamyl-tRNA reductase
MTWQIFAAEINFQDTPPSVRERFNESEKNIRRLLAIFRRRVEEVYILSNRHRFTVYIAHENLAPLTEFFHAENHLKGYVQFYYNSGESVTHLMATASGLLSSVKGERRILADIAKCLEWATSESCIGMTLDHVITKAIETGKTVRTQTAIDNFCASVVEAGMELLYNRLENLHKKNFLIIGTGKLARIALEYLTREGITTIALAGHETGPVAHLAKRFGIRQIGMRALTEYFSQADVIIGVSHEEIEKEFLGPRKGEDNNRSRVIMDLGIPPNFDPETIDVWAEEFYNLDDLRRLQPSPLESLGGLEAAWRMVMKASGDFTHVLQLLSHSPVLNAYLVRQFTLKNADLKIKPRRTLRSMLTFKRSDNIAGVTSVKDHVNVKTHANNHVAENGADIVKYVRDLKKFRFLLSEN